MGNKKSNTKKPKQKNAGVKGGSADFEMGNPQPVKKQKKKK